MATTSPGVTPSWRRPWASDTTSSTNSCPVLRLFPAMVTGKSRRKVNNRLRHWQIWAIIIKQRHTKVIAQLSYNELISAQTKRISPCCYPTCHCFIGTSKISLSFCPCIMCLSAERWNYSSILSISSTFQINKRFSFEKNKNVKLDFQHFTYLS